MPRRLAAFLALLAPLAASADDPAVPAPALSASALPAQVDDAGILLHVDLASFRLEAFDLDTAAIGPILRVSVGSPSNPTPTGEFRPIRLVANPSWTPGPVARSSGARPHAPSGESPLGLGKLPLEFGAIQIHAGAHPLQLGKPMSLGCVSVDDASWLRLIAWLEERESLQSWRRRANGEIETGFRRPVRVVVGSVAHDSVSRLELP
jgi:hypothetical protein